MGIVKKIEYDSGVEGKSLVVLGAVHGNEKCGTQAILRMAKELDNGCLKLKHGTLVMVPITNQKAYNQNVRFVDRNLNRQLHPSHQGKGYEDQINSELCAILESTDVLLDLHSYASQGGPFIFLGGGNQAENDFAKALGVNDFVYGWQEAFGNANTQVDPYESMGTTEYTRYVGGIGVTLECGHHYNDDAPDVGYKAIINALVHLQMLEGEGSFIKDDYRCVHMKLAFYKEKAGKLAKQWKHYDSVKKGQVLAEYEDDKKIVAPEDGYIILPKLDAEIGKEWFFFGVGSEFPD